MRDRVPLTLIADQDHALVLTIEHRKKFFILLNRNEIEIAMYQHDRRGHFISLQHRAIRPIPFRLGPWRTTHAASALLRLNHAKHLTGFRNTRIAITKLSVER